MILAISIVAVILAVLPAGLFLKNLPLFALPESSDQVDDASADSAAVSVLIPARNEQNSIHRSVTAALASEGVDIEVIVLDDHSSDATPAIVAEIAASDPRVQCLTGAPLPAGWNGKQYACKQLADAAGYQRIVFLDADVRLQPRALRRLMRRQDETGVALLSAFPHQETGTWLEKGIIPLMHFILLGFLPLDRMRASPHPAYAAGCGQLFMTDQSAYRRSGTHESIRSSRHDGLMLPRAYRESGLMTDVMDGTTLASCRMYHNASEVVRGVLKNAVEGIANPRLIVPFSIMLLGSSLLPVLALLLSLVQRQQVALGLSLFAVALAHLPRYLAAIRFRQSALGVVFHSIATPLFVALQWLALVRFLQGKQVAWRGRVEV